MSIPLIATYRLQLNAEFTLHAARALVPYLHRLGISHLYLSPVLAARKGSTHGYDVTDPTQVSAALGGDEAFLALAQVAHAHGMGIVLDIVPNHMGIGPDNPYWDDLLRNGKSSRFATWFDVAWRAPTRRLAGKVLVPVLGDTLERVVTRDELTIEATDDGIRVRYFQHHFPFDPATLPPELESLDAAALRRWTAGAEGRERLRRLLARQHYELAFWRSAHRDINYRRFFDANELISLRVESRDVFDATHRAVLQFVADGIVDGLRVDHIDGLLEPTRYLERLREAVDARRPPSSEGARFPIYVEKILGPDESLPCGWPVEGTTGYEFLTSLEDVFIDPAGYAALEARYRHGRSAEGFREVAIASKRRSLRTAFNADVRRIAPMLASVSRRAGWPQRTIAAYAGAIVEVIAALPVYRTYLDAERPEPDEHDRSVLEEAFAQARRNENVDGVALDALEQVLLGLWRHAEDELRAGRLSFVLRWQQLGGPAAAKGVEDTALYVYAPLTSRNEVGGDPSLALEGAVQRLHTRLSERARLRPRSLNATNTHDTKRSADVRARLDVLSERAEEWERGLRRWRRRHRPLRTLVKGRLAPTRTADDFIYQAMIGLWPLTLDARTDASWLDVLRDRLSAHALKAVREAKVSTNWIDPDTEYEAAIASYLARVLDGSTNQAFLHDMDHFTRAIAPQAMWNALGRLVVHLTAPGVPDLYQGDELWFAALVDPDNRRPVDWIARDRALDVAAATDTEDSGARLRGWRDSLAAGELKMFLVRQLLRLRRVSQTLFERGSYQPLEVRGTHADHILAYRRADSAGSEVVVVVPRLTGGVGEPPIGEGWRDTVVESGNAGVRDWSCAIQGGVTRGEEGWLRLGELFRDLPIAVLLPAGKQ